MTDAGLGFGVGAALALSLALASPLAAAETRACETEADATLQASLEKIQRQLDLIWVKRGPDWITAYDIAGTPKNPFDVSNQGSGVEATHGYAWLRDVGCAISEGPEKGAHTVTYRAAAYRFKEGKSRWSDPMADGVIAEYILTPGEPDWQIRDNSKDETIFLPDGTMRMPRPEELPASSSWPDKRCPPSKTLQGKRQGQTCGSAPPKANEATGVQR